MALAFVPTHGWVLLSSGWCSCELVAVAKARWVESVEKQSNACEGRKLLKCRGVGLFASVKSGTGLPRWLVGRVVVFWLIALNAC
jgi:hypothetical protein